MIVWERINGLDFTSITNIYDLGQYESLVGHGSTSCDKYLKRVLKYINIGSKDRILDIGCAKGGAMYCMTKFPFAKIRGIEISSTLANIAIKNFLKLREPRVHIENIDAIFFENYSEYNIYYFYHPFPKEIMDKVLLRMKLQIDLTKEVIIIYNNPVCHNQVINNGFYKIKEFPDMWGNGIFLYSNFTKPERLKDK